jgi:predicted ATPase/DNA-binding CsgD family transcriptional regulator
MVTAVGQSAAAATVGGVHGFPAALTSFIGRDGPLREVARLLEEYRLVTVTGPGGSGKTRLAGEVAWRVAGRFADGAWLAELAPVRDEAQVPGVVAAALGIPEQPGMAAGEVVARVLARQQLLLVLDNCEHVLGAAAALCAGLLAACDDVRVLATSREPLRVAGEVRYRLAPMVLPGDRAGEGGSEAVALFADRARRADARFALDEETLPMVARLVARLDGMPLAIELAAARVEGLGVAQLLDHLDDRFGLLVVTSDRLAAARQRSLAATVEWSYELLDERERRVFRAVSLFPSAFTLQGAEAVAGADAGAAVLNLVDCSLLAPPQTGPDGRVRYAMLETLRVYGTERLAEADETESAAAALARYALNVAEGAAAGLASSITEVAAVRWLDAEEIVMLQALAWAADHDSAIALRLAVALAPWWDLRGRAAGRYQLLRELASRAAIGSDEWCTAQFWLGQMALRSADLTGALGHFTVLRNAVADLPPSRALVDGLTGRSVTYANLGRIPEAIEDARRSLSLAEELDYPAGEALALADLVLASCYVGDQGNAGHLARLAEQIPADVPGWISRLCSSILTPALASAGDLAAAQRSCATGLARARDAGDLQNQARLLTNMAFLDQQEGRTADATAHLREALQIATRAGGHISLLDSLDSVGHLCAITGRHAEAITVWAALETIRRREAYADAPSDAHRRQEPLHTVRQALGPARAHAAQERGTSMSLSTAAEYALMLTSPGPKPRAAATGPGKLSVRERELITLVAQGRTDAQIAAQLYISIRTVRSHLDRIRDKTGCRRRADLTRLALSAGLL